MQEVYYNASKTIKALHIGIQQICDSLKIINIETEKLNTNIEELIECLNNN